MERRGITFETDAYVVGEHLIWGATARILEHLLERLERRTTARRRLALSAPRSSRSGAGRPAREARPDVRSERSAGRDAGQRPRPQAAERPSSASRTAPARRPRAATARPCRPPGRGGNDHPVEHAGARDAARAARPRRRRLGHAARCPREREQRVEQREAGEHQQDHVEVAEHLVRADRAEAVARRARRTLPCRPARCDCSAALPYCWIEARRRRARRWPRPPR